MSSSSLALGFKLLVLLLVCVDSGVASSSISTTSKLQAAATLSSIRHAERNGAAPKPLVQTRALELVHRSSFMEQGFNHEKLLLESLERDELRVELIRRKVEGSSEASRAEDITGPVTSGLLFGSGEYFVRLGVGTPARQVFMVLDTGSDIPWLQCTPCKSCYKQADPIFEPRNSTSFQRVSCTSQLCKQLEIHGCAKASGRCLYQVSYGDGSYTMGEFSTETFTLGSAALSNVSFGCGYDNQGLFAGAGGLLGLGGGKLSFVSQLGSSTPKRFSYCLVDRSDPMTKSTSTLIIGSGAIPAAASFTPMVRSSSQRLDTFYYASLVGASVGGNRLQLTGYSSSSQQGGEVIIDSGTSVTRLPTSVYALIRDAFRNSTTKLPAAAKYSLFDTCFNFSKMETVDVPTVVLHFQGGADLQLPPSNYLVPINTAGNFCFAFAATSMNLGIIGNIQQQTFRIGFDLQSSKIAFVPHQCK